MLSPKVWIPAAIQIVAGIVLWIVTHDQAPLIAVLSGLVTGVAGGVAPPAKGVKQRDVAQLSRARGHRK